MDCYSVSGFFFFYYYFCSPLSSTSVSEFAWQMIGEWKGKGWVKKERSAFLHFSNSVRTCSWESAEETERHRQKVKTVKGMMAQDRQRVSARERDKGTRKRHRERREIKCQVHCGPFCPETAAATTDKSRGGPFLYRHRESTGNYQASQLSPLLREACSLFPPPSLSCSLVKGEEGHGQTHFQCLYWYPCSALVHPTPLQSWKRVDPEDSGGTVLSYPPMLPLLLPYVLS